MTGDFKKGFILGMSLNKPIILGGMSMNYSTQEQSIGTWIDGRPVYQKVFDEFTLLNDTPYDYIMITTATDIIPLNATGYCNLVDPSKALWKVWIPTTDAGFGYFSNIQKNASNDVYITTNTLKSRGSTHVVPVSKIESICIILTYIKVAD